VSYVFLEERTRPGADLLVSFHGTGASERQFAGLAAELMPGAGHIAPRGDVSEHGALRFFRRRAEGVYDMEDLAARTAAMVGFLDGQKARLSPSAMVGLGYSNGANILASVLWAAPGLFDAAVLMHPLIPFRPAPADLAGMRVLITAGRRDPICPAPLTEALAGHLREDGASVEVLWHDGGHEVRPEEISAVAEFLASVPGVPQGGATGG
jgi:phospholipase/carboxylesterase